MSYYEDYVKDDLLSSMEEFLGDHPVSELLEIVASAVARNEYENE